MLSGCVSSGVDEVAASPAPTPVPAATELDKQAWLAEGTDVVKGYNAAMSQITSDYSVDASVLSPWASPEKVSEMRDFQNRLRLEGKRVIGDSEISSSVLQDIDVLGGRYTILTCEAMDNVRVLDSAGNDITPAGSESSATMQNVLVGREGELRVAESVVWSGSSIC